MAALVDTALIAAAVSAVITALGWFASHWSEKQLEAARRAERINDVQTALLAEIESNLTRYTGIDLDANAEAMRKRILASKGGKPFTPFVPRYVNEIVFEAIIADIHILPSETIGDVVSYYKQEYKLRELVEDLRSDKFEQLDQDRKARIYVDYIWQVKAVRTAGEKAKRALATSLGLKGQLNNPAGAQILTSGTG